MHKFAVRADERECVRDPSQTPRDGGFEVNGVRGIALLVRRIVCNPLRQRRHALRDHEDIIALHAVDERQNTGVAQRAKSLHRVAPRRRRRRHLEDGDCRAVQL